MGRFAPSPSGDLHFGSLYTAAASYLDARARGGRWLLRIEDLDVPRSAPGAADRIRATLQGFGFRWDGEVTYQSARTAHYQAALDTLQRRGLTFECSCSRSQLADEARYPGLCRAGPMNPGVPRAIRLRVDSGTIEFTDRIQGRFRQNVAAAVGDPVLRRRDGMIAYLLAVVVDDAAQGITDVVRGADLLDNTPRQILLQRLLDLPTPAYAHVPVLTEPDGRKLAKSARSVAADPRTAGPQLHRIFDLLGLRPPAELAQLTDARLEQAWRWAFAQWRAEAIPRRLARPLEA